MISHTQQSIQHTSQNSINGLPSTQNFWWVKCYERTTPTLVLTIFLSVVSSINRRLGWPDHIFPLKNKVLHQTIISTLHTALPLLSKRKQQCSLSSDITLLHAAICHFKESRKAWREGDRTLTVCTSPRFHMYTSRASTERPVLPAVLIIGSTPTKRHWYSLQSSEWNVLLSEDSAHSWLPLA